VYYHVAGVVLFTALSCRGEAIAMGEDVKWHIPVVGYYTIFS
jgi:hypothetical protein